MADQTKTKSKPKPKDSPPIVDAAGEDEYDEYGVIPQFRTGLVLLPESARNYVWTDADHALVGAKDVLPQQPVGDAFVMVAAILLEADTLAEQYRQDHDQQPIQQPVGTPGTRESDFAPVTILVDSQVEYPDGDFIQRHTPRSGSVHPSYRPIRAGRGKPGSWSPYVHGTPASRATPYPQTRHRRVPGSQRSG
ncbi:MAG: hypothetical protein JKY23_06020 [Nitrospinaceae bacterium]|nr:hypothetical protein [Nitrospinaceae bacterium]